MSKQIKTQKALTETMPVISGPNHDSDQAKGEREKILSAVNRFNRFVGTLQENVHNTILIPSVLYAWKYRDTGFIAVVLNGLLPSKATIRIESVVYWLDEYAGFSIRYDKEKGQFNAKSKYQQKSKSPLAHTFSYDLEHLDILKHPSNRYWKVAPVEINLLKAPKVDEGFQRLATESAKALLIGEITIEQLEADINAMMALVNKAKHDRKVKEWVSDWNSPDQVKAREEKEKVAA